MTDTPLHLTSLPDRWRLVPFWTVAGEVTDRNVGLRERNLLSLSYGRVVRKNINSAEGLLPESFDGYQIVEQGDTVLRLTDLQNDQRSLRTGFVQERGIITSAYVVVRPKSIDQRFLAWLLHAYDSNKAFYALGGGLRQGMRFADLKGLAVPLPPTEEQRRIADFLDDQVTRIDETVGLRRQQLGQVETLPASISNVFLAQCGNDGPPLSALAGICDTAHKTAPGVPDGGYWIAGTSAVRAGRIVTRELRETDESGFREWTERATPSEGDLLLTREAPVGEVGLLEKGHAPIAIGQRVVLLQPGPNLSPRFLRLVLMSSTLGRLIADAVKGSLHPHLNMSDIRRLRIPECDPDEQRRLGGLHSDALDLVDELRRALLGSSALLVERKRSLITAAVTGAFDVSSASVRAAEAVMA
ncbi:MAG: restriction endonuclease subunit S [Ilumatobacteraceae bacterium]|nr:restriction endonuclease subunit S [Ilumatobacteraceae bacterium]